MNTPDSPPFKLSFSTAEDGYRLLNAAQWVPRPLEEVFDFFQRPANLGKITPPGQKMRIEPPFPEIMSPGDVFSYRLQVMGIPLKWIAKIDSVTPPHGFTDTMLKGPYRAWIHTHRFETQNNGTLILDEVRYKIYGCRIGHRHFFKPQLEKIFRARAEAVREFFTE
ncbi:MAG: SRPBCC family protein [Verrucomicrobia bacterium]|nr:SRPBCC family protein [Verrucomicrobiota bacterium]MCH8526760.1 SRPBCC family protein [Kiritimatiellia bacterium]